MRGAGVGDGLGDGSGVGDGVWASASSGNLESARPAAPSAGSSLTKVRRLVRVFDFLFFFMLIDRVMDSEKSFPQRRKDAKKNCSAAVNYARMTQMHAEITTEGIKYAG